eukprot:4673066-Prymnesium_polylepis.1
MKCETAPFTLHTCLVWWRKPGGLKPLGRIRLGGKMWRNGSAARRPATYSYTKATNPTARPQPRARSSRHMPTQPVRRPGL